MVAIGAADKGLTNAFAIRLCDEGSERNAELAACTDGEIASAGAEAGREAETGGWIADEIGVLSVAIVGQGHILGCLRAGGLIGEVQRIGRGNNIDAIGVPEKIDQRCGVDAVEGVAGEGDRASVVASDGGREGGCDLAECAWGKNNTVAAVVCGGGPDCESCAGYRDVGDGQVLIAAVIDAGVLGGAGGVLCLLIVVDGSLRAVECGNSGA